jgi:hypothetical protein
MPEEDIPLTGDAKVDAALARIRGKFQDLEAAVRLMSGKTSTGDELFLMANLYPKRTGLPFIVWISVRGGARHAIRVKVSRGPKVKPEELITVALLPHVHEIDGLELTGGELELLQRWVDLNWGPLIEYWNEDIDTAEVIERLKKLPEAQ